ncbi:hypothetical protein [Vibrio phage vB_VmeM-Yong XC32]|nr:hypothetical protein [Vibrio phage vB_VmeM-Yong XC31]QAX96480.1 hypothetical protein [Vibrio phage vB_VmeM-Yong XC32]QAX96797.1 hypothetical protein [Vibrio phage vB_VmeM-Yong MS31]QAX97116.1 hypothetical protein [Vibrio phage vB_VmeM-Yong MS32]
MRSFSKKFGRGPASQISKGTKSAGFRADGALLVTGSVVNTPITLPYAANVELSLADSDTQHLELAGDVHITAPELRVGGSWKIYIRQDATGGHDVTFGANLKNIYGTPVLSAANATTLMTLIGRGDGNFDYTLTAVATI